MNTWWPAGYFTSCFYSIPVPLFFMLSGYSAGGLGTPRVSLFKFLRRKSGGILLPFFFWNAVLILLVLRAADQSWLECGILFLTGVWQLYYLFVLLQLLFLKQFVSRRYLPHVLVAAAFCAVAYYGLANYWMWTRGITSTEMEVHFNRTVFPWAIYFFTGVLLRQRPQSLEWLAKRRWWLVAIWAMSYLAYSTELRYEGAYLECHPLQQIMLSGLPFQWAGAVSLIVLFCEAERRHFISPVRKALGFFGKESYGIYLAHTTLLVLLLKLYDRSGFTLPFALEVPAAVVLLWVASWSLVRGARMLPWRATRRLLAGG